MFSRKPPNVKSRGSRSKYKHIELKCTWGTSHDYVGMMLDFENGRLTMYMVAYVKNMLEEIPLEFKANEKVANPVTSDMFDSDDDKYLNTEQRELFHRTIARALFLCKRGRPDVQPIVSVLCTRVKKPTGKDMNKLVRMMRFLNSTVEDKLVLSTENGIKTIE